LGIEHWNHAMTSLDILALLILFLIGLILVGLFCVMAMLPGRIARTRNHAYTDAVKIGGWASLLFGGLFWPLILVWAYMSDPPRPKSVSGEPTEQLDKEA
jgi:hypothetical protein